MPSDAEIRTAVLAVLHERARTASACPSDVARRLSAEAWRRFMPQVREAASRLAIDGQVEITQRGIVVAPEGPWKGPIRIRLPRT
jgi:hypothetical protein